MDTASIEGVLEIAYRDADLLVLDKPSGMAVHPGWAPRRDTVVEQLARMRERGEMPAGAFAHNVHRLDRATSGLLLTCFDKVHARRLQATWSQVDKRYLALVRGRPGARLPAIGVRVVDHPIPQSDGGERVPAVSSLRVLATSAAARCTLVEVRPHTGRLHQVRRHLKHLAHPIVGDVRYGDGRINRAFRTDFGLHRLALHAWSLRFEHPATGERVRIDRPPSLSFARALAALDLPASPGDAGRMLALERRPRVRSLPTTQR